MSSLKKIVNYLNEIESYINSYKLEQQAVSKASVGWHLDHTLKVVNNVIKAIQTSDPENYENNITFTGKVCLMFGYFPRGKGKAPKHVKPPEVIVKEDLVGQIALARTNVESISSLHKNAYFKHPLFGNINTKRVGRFLETHTNHHLKIVREILK